MQRPKAGRARSQKARGRESGRRIPVALCWMQGPSRSQDVMNSEDLSGVRPVATATRRTRRALRLCHVAAPPSFFSTSLTPSPPRVSPSSPPSPSPPSSPPGPASSRAVHSPSTRHPRRHFPPARLIGPHPVLSARVSSTSPALCTRPPCTSRRPPDADADDGVRATRAPTRCRIPYVNETGRPRVQS